MKYTKFTIENYKGIQSLTLDFTKQPSSKIITLVGLNESGKTSILQAINLLQHNIAQNERHKLIPKKDKLKFSGKIRVTADLIVTPEDNLLIKNKAKEWDVVDIKNIEKLVITKEYKFENSEFIEENNYWSIALKIRKKDTTTYVDVDGKTAEWQNIVAYLRDEIVPRILYYPDFLFDFPNRIYLDKETSALKAQTQFRHVVQDILTSIDKDLSIESHLINRLKNTSEANQEALDHTLTKMSAEISKVVLGAWKNIMDIQGKEIFVEAKSETNKVAIKNTEGQLVTEDRTIYYLEFRLKEGTEKYFVAERSLGFKWFFTFLLFTEFRKNRKTDQGETLFLLDEPASNLHSTAQKKLLSKFEDLVSKGRLIYTTHSHHLINPKLLSGTYIVKNEAVNYKKSFDFDTNNTDIKATLYKEFVSKHPDQQDYFKPILDTLEYQPGLLEKVPEIIITEGKFDYYIFKYVNEIILKNKYSSLRFYPGNGADSCDQVISLYLAWVREFKIILDGDEAGKKAKIRYLKVFGDEIKDRIKSFADIDSSFNFPIEDLFTEDEKILITKKFDPLLNTFIKSKFNTAIQAMFINNEKIILSDVTIARFEKLFQSLK